MTAAVVSEARVPVAPYQQVPGTDLTAIGVLAQGSVDNVVENVLISGVGYTGMSVSQVGTSNIVVVQPGYLIKGGPAYSLRDAFNVDVTSAINSVPDSSKTAIVLIIADGQEFSPDETRTFVDASKLPTDPTTPAPTVTLPTPTRVIRSVVISSPAGAADIAPNPPSYNGSLALIATVIVSNTAILSVIQNTATQITRLDQLVALVNGLTSQISNYGTQIAGLLSSVSALAISDANKFNTLQTEITALQQALNALANKQATQATGSIYTVTDYYTDTTGLTVQPSNPTYKVGSGLTFPSNGAQVSIVPTTISSSKFTIQNNKLIPAYTNYRTLGSEPYALPSNSPSTGFDTVTFNSLSPISTALTMRGFGVERTRYGSIYIAQSTAQLLASGDPNQLFAINPSDLNYQGAWADWRSLNPELNHNAGYWHDLTSRGYWTPQIAGNPVTGLPMLDQVHIPQSTYMLSQFCLFLIQGTTGDIRMLICDDNAGTPDFTRVVADVTCPYSYIGSLTGSGDAQFGAAATFNMPYPILLKASKKYHYVFLSSGDHKIKLARGATAFSPGQSLGGPILAVGQNGAIYQYTNADFEVCSRTNAANFIGANPTGQLLIPLNPLYQGGGIDAVDMITPAIVPDGCDIRFGMYSTNGQFQEFAPIASGGTSLLAGRPSSVNLVLEINMNGGGLVAPIIDLGTGTSAGTASGNTAKQSGTLTAESPIRTPPSAVTKITRSVTLVNFNPSIHTYTEQVETGTGYSTLTAPTTIATPVLQPDGSYLLGFSWTLGAAVATFKILMSGTTSDTTRVFTEPMSITTATP